MFPFAKRASKEDPKENGKGKRDSEDEHSDDTSVPIKSTPEQQIRKRKLGNEDKQLTDSDSSDSIDPVTRKRSPKQKIRKRKLDGSDAESDDTSSDADNVAGQQPIESDGDRPEEKSDDSSQAGTNPIDDGNFDTQPGPSVASREEESSDESARTVRIGYIFFKRFEDGYIYEGKVVGGICTVRGARGRKIHAHKVKYEDGDKEDLTIDEILMWPTEDPRIVSTTSSAVVKRYGSSKIDMAKKSLMCLPGLTEEEIDEALDAIGPPYGQQAAVAHIQKTRSDGATYKGHAKFKPHIGMKVRVSQGGSQYTGAVTNDGEFFEVEEGNKIKMWEVTYDSGGCDDMDWHQLLGARADRPVRTHPSRGRQLGCLELFSGCGMVSQEFAERKWRVRNVDNSPKANPTDRVDVMKFQLQDIDFVPDFIWCSPPCFTYSLMSAGRHRQVHGEQYEKTDEAHEHNSVFTKMTSILSEAKSKNPHLIVVIENPKALLGSMPMMKHLEEAFPLYKATVDYCAFGRSDKKPTNLWTNDFGLYTSLNEFRCKTKCPYKNGVHPIGARANGKSFNAAAIPDALAEEVAEYVNAKFVMDRIRYTKSATL